MENEKTMPVAHIPEHILTQAIAQAHRAIDKPNNPAAVFLGKQALKTLEMYLPSLLEAEAKKQNFADDLHDELLDHPECML